MGTEISSIDDSGDETVVVVGDSNNAGTIVVVEESGPIGPSGPTGPAGPIGLPGPPGPPSGSISYVHQQSVLSKLWMVTHALNKHPAVTIEDAAGSVMHGTVQYLDNDNLTITFADVITGRANCT